MPKEPPIHHARNGLLPRVLASNEAVLRKRKRSPDITRYDLLWFLLMGIGVAIAVQFPVVLFIAKLAFALLVGWMCAVVAIEKRKEYRRLPHRGGRTVAAMLLIVSATSFYAVIHQIVSAIIRADLGSTV